MFNYVSARITENMVKSGAVADEDKELYLFGIQQGLTIVLNLVTTVIIGLAFGVLWQVMLFMTAYIPLRSFAGGYHAKTPQRCYVLSILLLIAVALMIKYVDLHIYAQLGLLISASITVFVMSPVGNENKPLDELEKKVYKRKTIVICISEISVAIVFLCLNLTSLAVSMIWAVVVCAGMLILGKVKNSYFSEI